MMKLADAFSEKDLFKLARGTVNVGDVYEITMSEVNGITPKNGDSTRDKYFIVLGFDSEGVAYGGVIINSQINKNLPPYLKLYHMPLKHCKYPFLRYDSFVDCVQLKRVYPHKFNEWNYLGEIDNYDVELIIGTVKESPRETEANLARYGL